MGGARNSGPKPSLTPPVPSLGIAWTPARAYRGHRGRADGGTACPPKVAVDYWRERNMMLWLPVASDFQGDLQAALKCTDREERLEMLFALSQHRLGFLETIQLDRAVGQVSAADRTPEFSPVRLAILASSTVDHLVPAIRVAGLRRRLLISTYTGP